MNEKITLCDFCHEEPVMVDDCGEWALWPDPEIEEGRFTCLSCYNGEPGRKHRQRYGVGDR
jgi:formylmethanofuran dehydrogenase subunit E